MRIYFDWNVLTQLKNPKTEPFISLASKVEALKKYALMPYSAGHVSDLMKGWDDSVGKNEFIYKDLGFISEFSQNQMFVHYWGDEAVKPMIGPAEAYFDSIKDSHNQPLAEMMDFRKMVNDMDEQGQALMQPLIRQLETTMVPFSETTAKELKEHGINFPIPDKPISMMELITGFAEYYDKMFKNPKEYKSLRNFLHKGLELEPKRISNFGSDAIEQLDKLLPGTLLGKSFSKHVEDGNSSSRTKNSDYDRFMMKYSQLDMFAFHPEKLTAKNNYENMTNDSMHAFYAAHCDVFVTADKHSLAKARAVYTDEKIEALVLTPQEFVEQFDSVIPKIETTIAEFISNLKDAALRGIEAGNILQLSNGTLQCHIKPTTIHMFNVVEYSDYSENKLACTFKSSGREYSKFTCYKEIEFLVNHLVDMLGKDYNGKAKLEWDVEWPLMQESAWDGRIWQLDNGVLLLEQNEQFQLVYIYAKPTPQTNSL